MATELNVKRFDQYWKSAIKTLHLFFFNLTKNKTKQNKTVQCINKFSDIKQSLGLKNTFNEFGNT